MAALPTIEEKIEKANSLKEGAQNCRSALAAAVTCCTGVCATRLYADALSSSFCSSRTASPPRNSKNWHSAACLLINNPRPAPHAEGTALFKEGNWAGSVSKYHQARNFHQRTDRSQPLSS